MSHTKTHRDAERETDLRAEIDRLQNAIASVENTSYKVRQLAAEGDHYTINVSNDANGCLAGARALYGKVLRHLDGEDC